MILLHTSYRYGVFLKYFFLNCNLVRLGVYMVKLCYEKMLILRCFLPKKTESPTEKKLNLPPPGKSRTPPNFPNHHYHPSSPI